MTRIMAFSWLFFLVQGCVGDPAAEKPLEKEPEIPERLSARIISSPNAFTNQKTVTIKFALTGVEPKAMCTLNGATPTLCESPVHYVGLADGLYGFAVYATDVTGQVSEPQAIAWTIDRVAPSLWLLEKPPVRAPHVSNRFTFLSDDPTATFECIGNGSQSSCVSPYDAPSIVGANSVSIVAQDKAGNQSEVQIVNWSGYLYCAETLLFSEPFDDITTFVTRWTLETPWVWTADTYTGPYALTDSPGGGYLSNQNIKATSLPVSPPQDLCWRTGQSELAISWAHKYGLAAGDELHSDVNVTGSWDYLWGASGTNTQATWSETNLHYSTYNGSSPLSIRFSRISDANVNGTGWLIDDVLIHSTEVSGATWSLAGSFAALYPPRLVDLNGDGQVELLISTYANNHDSHLLAINVKTKQTIWSYYAGGSAKVSAPLVADLDHDGKPEIAFSVALYNRVVVLEGESGAVKWFYALGKEPSPPGIGNINGDSWDDLVVESSGTLFALDGTTGSVHWTQAINSASDSYGFQQRPRALIVRPRDDKKPIVVSGSFGGGGYAFDASTGTKLWGPTGGTCSAPAVADFDSDGDLDVVLSCIDSSTWTYYLAFHDLSSGTLIRSVSFNAATYGRPNPPALADLNGDGVVDVVVNHFWQVTAVDGATGETLWIFKRNYSKMTNAAIGDFDGDGQLEVVIGKWILDGLTGALKTIVETLEPYDTCSPTLGDLFADGKLYLLLCGNTGVSALSWETPMPTEELLPWPTYGRTVTSFAVFPE